MPSYLDAYGAEAERSAQRAKIVKRAVIVGLAVALVAIVGYFSLRTRGQEQVVGQFLADLKRGDYQGAYQLWGCTPQTPCTDYPSGKFDEDWGPKSPFSNAAGLQVENVDYCDTGVVFTIVYPHQDTVGLWVDRSTNVIGFAPWVRCPGRHLQLREFFHSLFTSSKNGAPGSS